MNDVSNRAVREFSEFLDRIEINFPKPTCTMAYEITMKSTIVSALITLDTEKQMDERFWNHLRVQRNILDFLYTLWLDDDDAFKAAGGNPYWKTPEERAAFARLISIAPASRSLPQN